MKSATKLQIQASAKIISVALPIICFFIFNTLTPVWWDDFIMSCVYNGWHEPSEKLLSSFSDVINSTLGMYASWHGRSPVDFINFLFMYFGDKIIFNICNTIVYGILVGLICYHVTGSIKKIHPFLFLFVNILLWLFIPAWGQNFLWLTGSCNYLWTSVVILFFLPSFISGIKSIAKGYVLSEAREHYILSQKRKGVLDIQVKTPIPADDFHSGLKDGLDVLPQVDVNNIGYIEYITHNSSKAVYYGIHSLQGIMVEDKNWGNWKDWKKILKDSWKRRHSDHLTKDDWFLMIYDDWQ